MSVDRNAPPGQRSRGSVPGFRTSTRSRHGRLALRIMTLFVLFAVGLLITVGVLLTFLSFRSQRSAVAHTQSEIAKRAALDVSAFLSTVEQSLLVLAQTQDLADLDPADQRRVLNQLIETLPTFDELTYVDALGREQAKVSPYHTFTAGELGNQAESAGFRQAMRGQRYLSRVTFSNYSGQPVVSLALPVSDLRQETVGVLMAHVNFHRMWNIVTGLEVGQTGYAYVVDEQGRLIAYRDISPVLRHEDLSRLPTVAAFLQGRPAIAEYRGLAGMPVVGAQAPIAGTPWAVVAELPTGEAYAGLQRMLGLLGLLMLGAVVVAAAMGRYLAGYIVRPIKTLQAGAAIIGQGDLEHTIEMNTGDEIEALAEAFNVMSRDLRRSRAEIERWNRELEALVEERTAELSALYAVASTVSQSLDLHEVLNNALDEVLQVMQTDIGWIYLVDEEMEGLTLSAYRGMDAALVQATRRLRFGQGFSGHVAQRGEPLLVREIEGDADLTPHPAALRGGLRSFAGVPLQAKGRILGVLGVASRGDRRFTRRETDLLSSIGRQVGIAVENARLYDQSREVAVLEERNRLAREIHDTLAQGLTGIVVQLEAAERVAARRPERAAAALERARTLARQSLEEARRSLWNLRPTPLERLSLSEALRQEAARLDAQDGLEVHFAITGEERRLPPDDELNLYRIAQEALTNVRKHAQAHTVTVTLAFDTDRLSLSVADDGIGGVYLASQSGSGAGPSTAPSAALRRGSGQGSGQRLGLVGMRERAHLLGGELRIESPPNAGTKVTVVVPCQ